MTDPVALTAELIRCPSVTPAEGGAIALIEARLAAAGFRTVRVDRNGIANLYARWGDVRAGARLQRPHRRGAARRRRAAGGTTRSRRSSRTAGSTAAAPRT